MHIICKQKCGQNLGELCFAECAFFCFQSWNNEFSIKVAYHIQIGYKSVIKCTGSLKMHLPLPKMSTKHTFTVYLCWQIAWGWPHFKWLQHPEGVSPAPGAVTQGRGVGEPRSTRRWTTPPPRKSTSNPHPLWALAHLGSNFLLFIVLIESSDDDKIVQYKWEEVKGPLNDKNKVISSGADSPVLQLKSLVPGIYTFKYANHCFVYEYFCWRTYKKYNYYYNYNYNYNYNDCNQYLYRVNQSYNCYQYGPCLKKSLKV